MPQNMALSKSHASGVRVPTWVGDVMAVGGWFRGSVSVTDVVATAGLKRRKGKVEQDVPYVDRLGARPVENEPQRRTEKLRDNTRSSERAEFLINCETVRTGYFRPNDTHTYLSTASIKSTPPVATTVLLGREQYGLGGGASAKAHHSALPFARFCLLVDLKHLPRPRGRERRADHKATRQDLLAESEAKDAGGIGEVSPSAHVPGL